MPCEKALRLNRGAADEVLTLEVVVRGFMRNRDTPAVWGRANSWSDPASTKPGEDSRSFFRVRCDGGLGTTGEQPKLEDDGDGQITARNECGAGLGTDPGGLKAATTTQNDGLPMAAKPGSGR